MTAPYLPPDLPEEPKQEENRNPHVNPLPPEGESNAFFDYAKLIFVAVIFIWIEMWLLNHPPSLPESNKMSEFLHTPVQMYGRERPVLDPFVVTKEIEARLAAEESEIAEKPIAPPSHLSVVSSL